MKEKIVPEPFSSSKKAKGEMMVPFYFRSLRIAVEIIHDDRDFSDFPFLIFAAFLRIYMILASVFESFATPVVLMFTIPLAATGSLLALLLTGSPLLNFITLIGFIQSGFWEFALPFLLYMGCLQLLHPVKTYFAGTANKWAKKTALFLYKPFFWGFPLLALSLFNAKYDLLGFVIPAGIIWYFLLIVKVTSSKLHKEKVNITRIKGPFKALRACLAGFTWFSVLRVPVFELVFQLLYPLFFLSCLAFLLTTITYNGNTTAVFMIIFGLLFLVLAEPRKRINGICS